MRKKVLIEDISYEGAGVGKVDGKVIFVPKTLIGEVVDAEIVKQNSKFEQGVLVDIEKASKARIDAVCPYFDKCGGCSFQHCEYKSELGLKSMILKRELSKVGYKNDVDIVESDSRFGYRNKIKLEVRGQKLGYFKAKSNEFFEIESCPIATAEINLAIKILKDYLLDAEYKFLKHIYIKQVDKNIGICFLFDKNSQKFKQKLKNSEKLSGFSVFFAYGDVLESNKTKLFCVLGNDKLIKTEDGFVFEIDISAFNQINDNVSRKMYDFVLENVSGLRVVNAYSGQGWLTALMSRVVKFVYGVEYQYSAHNVAQKLTGQMVNVENICGRVEDELHKILMKDRIDMIVLDPAREGCQINVLNSINDKNIQKIIYISCNFSTLVRDLFVLRDFYEIIDVKIFDMFPNTANMETVVILERKQP